MPIGYDRKDGRRAAHAPMLIAVVTALLSFTMVLNAAAEDAAQAGRAQQVRTDHESARPAAPQLLSVEIIPDAPGRGAGLQVGKDGARPPDAPPLNAPMGSDSGATR